MKSVKKMDVLILAIAATVFTFAVINFQKSRKNNGDQDWGFIAREDISIIGFFKESDCMDCVSKIVCNWQSIETEVMRIAPEVTTQLIVVPNQGDSFDTEQLKPMCDLPSLSLVSPENAMKDLAFPYRTPSIFLVTDRRIVSLQPIYTDTDMSNVRFTLLATLENLIADNYSL